MATPVLLHAQVQAVPAAWPQPASLARRLRHRRPICAGPLRQPQVLPPGHAPRHLRRRVYDSLGLRRFLGYELQQSPPDHSTLSRTRRRISLETHEQVFAWVLQRLREAGLADGRTVAVDATMLFANAALRTLRRKDSQAGYREFVEELAAAGVPTPTLAELAAFDRKRKGKTLSNQEWESPTGPDAQVAKMKAGTTHLAYKAEHAVDLESGALVGVTLQAAETAQGEGPEQVVADKGYHSDGVLLGLEEAGQGAHTPEPRRTWRNSRPPKAISITGSGG